MVTVQILSGPQPVSEPCVFRVRTIFSTSLRELAKRSRSFVHMFTVINQDEVNDMFPLIRKKDQPVLFRNPC